MPPASKDVGTNIRNLKKSKTKRSHKQIVAIAISEARAEGGKVAKKPKSKPLAKPKPKPKKGY
mgnify:CR=1 FL=1